MEKSKQLTITMCMTFCRPDYQQTYHQSEMNSIALWRFASVIRRQTLLMKYLELNWSTNGNVEGSRDFFFPVALS